MNLSQSLNYLQTNQNMLPAISIMTSKKDFRKLQHDINSQEKLWDTAEEKVMSKALEEALSCRKCAFGITETTMRIDIDNGKYIATRYPPYFSNPHKRDENISPLDNSPSPPELSFWNIITIPQRQRYYDQVEATLNNILNEQSQASTFTKTLTSTSTSTSTSTTLSPDAELSVLLAHYKVDYHIHQHYLSYRVPITLCRDAHDLHSLRKWNWKMAEIDAVIHSESKPEPGSEPNSSNSNTREWPVGCRKLGWPDDETLKMVHQTLLWKRAWRGRQKKLEEVRARWVVIMEERRRERELLFARQAELLVKEASASASTFTVKVYCRGELRDVRELKRMAYSEPGLRVKRAAQSFGV